MFRLDARLAITALYVGDRMSSLRQIKFIEREHRCRVPTRFDGLIIRCRPDEAFPPLPWP